MARLLIRQIHGGESREIDDSSLPFFQNQGYVVIDTLDDSSDPSPYTYNAEESDFRYVQTGDIGDPDSTGGAELRTFFEPKIDRTGATAGQVPVLQADGSLEFGAGGEGGSVASVNGLTGAVELTADDLEDGVSYVRMTAAERAALDLLLTNGIVVVEHEGGADPVRPATTMRVLWVVPDDNRPAANGTTAGGDYAAVDGHDLGAFK